MPDEIGLASSSKLAEQATAKVKPCIHLCSIAQWQGAIIDSGPGLQADLSYSYWAAGQKQGTATVQEKVRSLFTLLAFKDGRGHRHVAGHQHAAVAKDIWICRSWKAASCSLLQKLTEEEAREQARLEKAASERGASVWNQVHPAMPLHGFRARHTACSVLEAMDMCREALLRRGTSRPGPRSSWGRCLSAWSTAHPPRASP